MYKKSLFLGGVFLFSGLTSNVLAAEIASQIGKSFEGPTRYQFSPRMTIQEAGMPESHATGTTKFLLKDVSLKGVPEDVDMRDIVAKYVDTTVSFNSLSALTESLTRTLRNEGYILSQVILPPQKVKGGRVQLHVINGYIDQILYEGDKELVDARVERILEKVHHARPLIRAELERQLMLVAGLPGVDISVVFRASKTVSGASDMFVTFKEDAGRLTVGNSNNTKQLGPWQGFFDGHMENVFGNNSSINIARAHSFVDKRTQFISGTYKHPLTDDELMLVFKGQMSKTNPGRDLAILKLRNTFKSVSLGLTYPLILGRHSRLDSGINLTVSDNERRHTGGQWISDL